MRPASAVHLIINCASGSGTGRELAELAERRCAEAGRQLTIHMPSRPGQLDQLVPGVVADAAAAGAVIAAAGGDGTVRTVAHHVAGTGAPLAVIPLGTFNFFARNFAIPEELEAAVEVMLEGEPRPVDLGEINDQLFLINASFGLYSALIKARERNASRFGRNRLVATATTLLTLMRGYPALDIELATGAMNQRLRTPMVFVGNNALQLRAVALDVASCARHGQLAVVVMDPLGRWGLLRLALHGLFRMLEREDALHSFCADSVTIRYRRRRVEVVMDGERLQLTTPLRFAIRREALSLLVPPAKRDMPPGEEE
ncbi:MAG: diacylglycerol kinase family protein [Spongiibacteraceae bacterium]|jgi:diacylglycerol kinase family enzyme|nr:diacylglycerol kinase family protein [Spongiibacteraceae bacterium]